MFTTTDPFNRSVHLKRETWENKILNLYGTNSNGEHGNSHPEMQKFLPEIKSTIENPIYIIRDTFTNENESGEKETKVNEKREEFVRLINDAEAEKLRALKVIVEFNEGAGEVVTTHVASNLKSFKTSGGIIYDGSKT